jgi:hypothetical protein
LFIPPPKHATPTWAKLSATNRTGRNLYLCVWVDHHDEAMEWARNKRFDVNPSTGALQVYQVEQAPKSVHSQPPGEVVPEGRLLAGRTHEELTRCGVPEALLPAVRSLRSESELDALAPHLPVHSR